jgi:hypothetical protein
LGRAEFGRTQEVQTVSCLPDGWAAVSPTAPALAERGLAPAGAVAEALQARVRLLCVPEPPPGSTHADMPHLAVTLRDQEVDLSRQDLDGLRGRLPRSLTSVETQAVLGHHPASEIERVALAEQSTLSPSPATAGAGCHGCCWAVLLPNWCNERATTPRLVVGPTCIGISERGARCQAGIVAARE